MANLNRRINRVEKEFYLGSMNFLRPPLKQIGNSIYEITAHFMSNGNINIIPTVCTQHLGQIRDSLLGHLENESFLYKTNIVTGSLLAHDLDLPSFVVLMDSLALAMDFEISPRPSDVQCDILLAICGQPVIVLTLIDGDKDSDTVTMYNASVTKGLSATLRKFMDESVNVIFGVLCRRDMEDLVTFQTSIEAVARDSSCFLPFSTLTTNPSKYEKIVTAFWAGVAETRSVISRDGGVDIDYLRFLTKDQCIILMENINKGKVEVLFKSGTGATTLMLEVARRLSKLGKTLLVCSSPKERERLRMSYAQTFTPDDLNSTDLSSFQHVVDETGKISHTFSGRYWRFSRGSTDMGEHSTAQMLKQLTSCEEEEFYFGSMHLLRPPLKQTGNSIYKIMSHFQCHDNIIPFMCPPHLVTIRDFLRRHLEEDSFLYKTNIVTGLSLDSPSVDVMNLPGVTVLMDSLALAMNFEISLRPKDVLCDILLVICGQPVMVLTLVDGEKEDSDTVTVYNASVARGVSSTLRKFMDESVNVIFGVQCQQDFKNLDTFRTLIEAMARDSSFFVTLNTLTTNPSKSKKIVRAFWAGVAETRSVISRDGRVDTDFLRFLTKDQCITLMENINNREVEVQFQTGTGATTLMVEVARRLARLDDTLLVCRSQQERKRLSSVYPNIKTATDLELSDLSKYTNIVDETGAVTGRVSGKLWRFIKSYAATEQLQLQESVDILEKKNVNTEKMLHLFFSSDRQDKLKHLFKELETLKLIDISFQGLLSAHHLPSSLALEFIAVKYSPSADRSRDQRLETEVYIRHLLDQLRLGIQGRRDLFPLLGDMTKQVKGMIPSLQAKVHYLELATTGRTEKEENTIKADISVDQYVPSMEHSQLSEETDGEHKTVSTTVPDTKTEEGIIAEETDSIGDDVSEVTDSGKIDELKKRLETLKKEADNKEKEQNDLREATDQGVEWEYNMDHLFEEMSTLRIHDVVTDVIGEDEIPVSTAEQTKLTSYPDDNRRAERHETRRCQVYQLRHLQHGTLKQGDILDIVREVITDDQSRLTSLRNQSDRLERVYGSPLYIIGEIRSKRSGPLSCLTMTLHRDWVFWMLDVSEDSQELVNRRESGKHHTDQFKVYWGTCSHLLIPVPSSPSTPTAPTYWETNTRVQVKSEELTWYTLLEMGVNVVGQVDTKNWISRQNRGWSVIVRRCDKHPGYCTKVLGEGSPCGVCLTDTLTYTPSTDVMLKYGVVVDIGRGRLAFIDLTRGRVLHRFDVQIRESLRPMFAVAPYLYTKCDVTMRLISGSDITMDDRKQNLIAKALFGQ